MELHRRAPAIGLQRTKSQVLAAGLSASHFRQRAHHWCDLLSKSRRCPPPWHPLCHVMRGLPARAVHPHLAAAAGSAGGQGTTSAAWAGLHSKQMLLSAFTYQTHLSLHPNAPGSAHQRSHHRFLAAKRPATLGIACMFPRSEVCAYEPAQGGISRMAVPQQLAALLVKVIGPPWRRSNCHGRLTSLAAPEQGEAGRPGPRAGGHFAAHLAAGFPRVLQPEWHMRSCQGCPHTAGLTGSWRTLTGCPA